MLGADVLVDIALGLQQSGNGDDQAHRLHKADPFEMREFFG